MSLRVIVLELIEHVILRIRGGRLEDSKVQHRLGQVCLAQVCKIVLVVVHPHNRGTEFDLLGDL